jgi:D-beta-D-heptose 7-phosphate kinase/D-beta-D-heptose 1-phosphate adenosyltransferase
MTVARLYTETLRKLEGQAPLVIGDLMLDAYLRGRVSRISPEAPVPVVEVLERRCTLGGAANVALNMVHLAMKARLVGVAGADAGGAELHRLLREAGIDGSGIYESSVRRTTQKTRVMGGVQQMLRLDEEDRKVLLPEEEDAVVAQIELALASGVSVVVLSDYAKGTLTPRICRETIARCRALRIPVLVDPKGTDFSKYRGATAVTPNWSELRAVLHGSADSPAEDLLHQSEALRREYDLDMLLATRGEDGISLISDRGHYHSPARAQQVFDVSGAGDTVMAVVAGCLAAGVEPTHAVDLANLAAGVVVSKVGTVPVDLKELKQRINERNPGGPKVLDVKAAASRIAAWKEQGQRIVFTNGCFDLLHVGHVTYLRKARALGDCLVVGLNTDASVQRLKGPTRPVVSENHRAEVLAALESVDIVVLFGEDTPLELINELRPNVLCKGADYSEETVVGAKEVRSWGGEIALIDLVDGASSTKLIARAATGKTQNA